MILREYLRYLILGNTVFITSIYNLKTFFRQEIRNNIRFNIFLGIVILYNIFLVLLMVSKWRKLTGDDTRNVTNYYALGVGILLIFMALILQKIRYIEILNFGYGHEPPSLLRSIANILGIKKICFGKKNSILSKSTKSLFCKNRMPNENKLLPQYAQNSPVVKVEMTRKGAKSEIVVMRDVFIDESQNIANFSNFIKKINLLKIRISQLNANFKSDFDKFIKISQVIESEMSAFNANPRFFTVEYTNLNNEINKYFGILKNSEITTILQDNTWLVQYISSVTTNRNAQSNTKIRYRSYTIFKLISKMKYLILLIIILILIFLAIFILSNRGVLPYTLIFICVVLCVLSFISIVLLGCIYISDLDCKGTGIKGCELFFNKQNEMIERIRNLESVNETTNFEVNLNKYLDRSTKNINIIQEYIRNLLTEKVSHKILLFNYLFDKISFVKDDFKRISNGKVDEQNFYQLVSSMHKSLKEIDSLLTSNIKAEIIEIFSKELAYIFYISSNKNIILKRIYNKIQNKKYINDRSTGNKCTDTLSTLCKSKEYTEDIFNIIVLLQIFSMLIVFF